MYTAPLCGRIPRPWQATAEILSQFAREPRRARAAYRAFVAAGTSQGRRPELQGGGLIRSLGGWKAVQGLRRGQEAYMADERILGTSAFVEGVLREVDAQTEAHLKHGRRSLGLSTLVQRVAKSLGLSAEAVCGRSRVPPAPVARHLVAYLWVHQFGRPASELALFWGQGRSHASWAARRGAEAAKAWSDEIPGWCR